MSKSIRELGHISDKQVVGHFALTSASHSVRTVRWFALTAVCSLLTAEACSIAPFSRSLNSSSSYCRLQSVSGARAIWYHSGHRFAQAYCHTFSLKPANLVDRQGTRVKSFGGRWLKISSQSSSGNFESVRWKWALHCALVWTIEINCYHKRSNRSGEKVCKISLTPDGWKTPHVTISNGQFIPHDPSLGRSTHTFCSVCCLARRLLDAHRSMSQSNSARRWSRLQIDESLLTVVWHRNGWVWSQKGGQITLWVQ